MNNIINNALSAKNVKMHGMSSSKWTTKDKITQFKGLVTLYKRDRDITQIDTAVAAKREYKGLVNLRKTIETNRLKLQNAVAGDRQQLRNTLAEHRELQLAYQNADPKDVIENLHQVSFTKRKVLDRLWYQLKQKSGELRDLKLEEALLQDRLTYADYDKLDLECEAQTITGKVQNAILKREAALAIQQTYSQIIDVMKKDALYFDAVLATIQSDHWYQSKCILNATKQGQLATEYKNDREQEYAALEEAVLADMQTRKADLQQMHNDTEKLQSNLKHLLRRDSDITLCVIEVEQSTEFADLHTDLEKIETALNFLRDQTLVTSFDKIYPSLEEQRRQKKRLNALVKKCERNRDIMLNKLNHAQLMRSIMETTMVETTGEYKKKKRELLDLINQEKEKKREYELLQERKDDHIARIRICLRQLHQLCKPIQPFDDKNEGSHFIYATHVEVAPPEEDETDGLKLIASLTPKLTNLMNNVQEQLDGQHLDMAYKYYEHLMNERRVIEDFPEDINTDSLLEGFQTEVSHLLTREEIKKISDEIVAAHTKEDDLVPMFSVSKKKKKFK